LNGAKVEIKTSNADGAAITELTDASGRVKNLRPGDYWIGVTPVEPAAPEEYDDEEEFHNISGYGSGEGSWMP
jgi:uncharacterized surface anchored protein